MTEVPPPSPDEVVVERDPTARPDDFGREQFFAYWHDPKTLREGGPPHHVRGQVFYTSVAEFVARHPQGSVRIITHHPDWPELKES